MVQSFDKKGGSSPERDLIARQQLEQAKNVIKKMPPNVQQAFVLNRFEHFLINTSEEGVRFVEEVGSPNLKILLDTYHMNIEEDSLGDAIRGAGDHLGMFHIGENNRRPPGRGHIPWDEVVRALIESGFEGDTVMEPIVHPGGGVSSLLAVWRDMTDGRDRDDAAREGLEFYRSKMAEARIR